MPGPRPGFLN